MDRVLLFIYKDSCLLGYYTIMAFKLNPNLDSKTAESRAVKLRLQINDLRYRYHVLNYPRLTHEVY